MPLTISDKINIALCILSFLLAAISVFTVIITLQQNSKMIENSSRPYIGIYSEKTDFGVVKYSIVLKNYGESKALITDFTCSIDLSKYAVFYNDVPFKNIIGMNLFPHETIIREINLPKLQEDKIKSITFYIKYKGVKEYTEETTINILCEDENNITRNHLRELNNSESLEELYVISSALQGIAEKML